MMAARISSSVTRLSWGAIPVATRYDVVQGSLSILRSTGGDFSVATTACLGDDVTSTTIDVTNTPDGTAYWYLVRAESCGGNGSYDEGGSQTGSRDAEIATSGVACP
jgi:hypothetical protein